MIVATVNEIVNDVVTSPNNIVNAFVDLFTNGKTQIIKNMLRMVK